MIRPFRVTLALMLLCVLGLPCQALAQPSSTDMALAETLYRQGRELMSQGKYADACSKFEESRRLDPATGTLLNLAACNEALGKFASAWLQFNEARHLARRDNREDRVRYADERLAAIEPQLSQLVVEVPQAADVEGLQVHVDGALIGIAARGVPMPLDPGKHEVSAEAPGRKPWREDVEIGSKADLKKIEIPLLEALQSSEAEPPGHAVTKTLPLRQPNSPERDQLQTERPIPPSVYVAGGTTLALAVGAGVTTFVYRGKKSAYEELNDGERGSAADAQSEANLWGWVNVGLSAATVVGAAVTGYLYFTRPEVTGDSQVSVAPFSNGRVSGLSLSGRF